MRLIRAEAEMVEYALLKPTVWESGELVTLDWRQVEYDCVKIKASLG